MDRAQAQRVIESLRKGIPPDGFVRHFTVGRASEIAQLTKRLEDAAAGALLLQANYGSGKTHLLRFIRECALEKGFAVSAVTLDCKGGVRFNLMDQVYGAICRHMEVPGVGGPKGIRLVFNFVVDRLQGAKVGGRNSSRFESRAVPVAVRAWATGLPKIQDRIEDWFQQPCNYRNQRRLLYYELGHYVRQHFDDMGQYGRISLDSVFSFHTQAYDQCWFALRDLERLLRKAGLKGLVLLFDEFEDIITNLNNIAYQRNAFGNLMRFHKDFPGPSFYAGTPEFHQKCDDLLRRNANWPWEDKGQETIDGLFAEVLRSFEIPTLRTAPLDVEELEELAMRILEAHAIAYGWKPDLVMRARDLDGIVRKAASVPIEDRARHTIIAVVKALDRLLEENE